MIQDAMRWFDAPRELREPIVACIDANQRRPKHIAALAPVATAVIVCEALGVDPHDMVKLIRNMESDLESPFAVEFRAMKDYARGELT